MVRGFFMEGGTWPTWVCPVPSCTMWTGIIIGLLLGILLGGAAMYVAGRSRGRDALQALQQERENERRDLDLRLSERDRALEQRQRDLVSLSAEVSAERQRAEGHREERTVLEQRLGAREQDLAQQLQEVVGLSTRLATEQQRNSGLEERLQQQRAELEALNQRMTQEFKLIANDLLEHKGRQLGEQQKTTLEHVLNPLKDRIKEFEDQVRKSYDEESRQRFALKGEVEKLLQQNMRLSQDADNLTKALKGDSKTQGDWGEMVLERLLESSGLVQGEEYTLQHSNTLDDGSRLRPDAVVNLPGSKHIIIDAKVSLTHYERYVAATDDAERDRMAKAHTDSMRAHMKGLSQKDYPKVFGIASPEFVFMFVPIESAFFLAQNTRRELVQEAIEQRIYIVTHSTLLASLKLFHSIWKNERIARNHLQIAERAGLLYDKFVGFTDDLIAAGNQLDKAKNSYKSAMDKLKDGPGNLVRQTEMLKELGAKTNKGINAALLTRAGVENDTE